ncbi:MAG: hypothetical protein ACFCBW_12965, partial [Candidatus Competibacterales bacterium]
MPHVIPTAAALAAAAFTLVTGAAAAADDLLGPDWPEGPGRETVGYFCQACHSLALVKQQRLSRQGWDELLTWMTQKQNMAALQGERRELFLDYLSSHFGSQGAQTRQPPT